MEKNFLPDFGKFKILLAVFLLAELVSLLLTLAASNRSTWFFAEFALRSLFILWIALLSSALLCLLRKKIPQGNSGRIGVTAFFSMQLITLFVSYVTLEVLPHWQSGIPLLEIEKMAFYLRTLGISALISLAFLRYLYVLFQWQQQIEAKAMVKVQVLQARMRPHFLFNSLNSIASLTRINPALAESLVEDLAELIRASLRVDEAMLVRLEEEIKLVNLYLAIEKQRFHERLTVRWELTTIPKDALLPPLSLQPLVENAVYYGIEPNINGGEILICGELTGKYLQISVMNSLPPQNAQSRRKGNQMALKNLTARLQACFPEEGKLTVEVTETVYRVTLVMPYQTVNTL